MNNTKPWKNLWKWPKNDVFLCVASLGTSQLCNKQWNGLHISLILLCVKGGLPGNISGTLARYFKTTPGWTQFKFYVFSMMFENMRLPWQGMVVEDVSRDVYCFSRKTNWFFLWKPSSCFFFLIFLVSLRKGECKDNLEIKNNVKTKIWNKNNLVCVMILLSMSVFHRFVFFEIGNLPCTRKNIYLVQ